jgi:hypothetical protein
MMGVSLMIFAMLNDVFLYSSSPCSVLVSVLLFALFGIGFDTESTEHHLELVRR